MISFRVKDGEIVVDYDMLMIPEFKEVLDRYGEKRGLMLLKYIYLTCDLGVSNALRHLDYELRESEARRLSFPKKGDMIKGDEVELVDRCKELYEFYGSTSEERMLYVVDKQVDLVRHKIEGMVELGEKDDEKKIGGKVYNEILKGYLANLDSLYAMKRKVRESIMSGSVSKIRGNKSSSYAELGNFRKNESKTGK